MIKLTATAFAAGALTFTAVLAHADDTKTKPSAPSVSQACVMQTGSRIPVKRKECVHPGRSYSKDDISTTGADTAADALRLLDPSITIHR
jgi:hypothetical protein